MMTTPADATNQAGPHLTLTEFTAHANGALIDADHRAHLADCAECAAEARRWSGAADGVRHLAATGQPPPGVIDHVLARLDEPQAAPSQTRPARSRRRGPLSGPRRRVLVPLATAALLVASIYGLGALSGGQQGTGADSSNLHAVPVADLIDTDCGEVKGLAGTLESVDGQTLTLRTASGELATVTTTSATTITHNVLGDLDDITDGTQVVVEGDRARHDEPFDGDGSDPIAARWITIASESVSLPDWHMVLGNDELFIGFVGGTVADADGTGFTVINSDGDPGAPVTVSADTAVIVPTDAGLGDLATGELVTVVGGVTEDGVFAAESIQQTDHAPEAPAAPAPPDVPGGEPVVAAPDVPSIMYEWNCESEPALSAVPFRIGGY